MPWRSLVLLLVVLGLLAWLVGQPAGTPPGGVGSRRVEHRVADKDAAVTLVPLQRESRGEAAPEGTPQSSRLLRVIIEGLAGDEARAATITLLDWNEPRRWPEPVWAEWSASGRVTELPLDDFFASVARRSGGEGAQALTVEVDHPARFTVRIEVPVSAGIERADGGVVHEARVRFDGVEWFPAFSLAVRDAQTRAHLEEVELRLVPTAFMGQWQRPGKGGPFTVAGRGLVSPIALRGGRPAGSPVAQVGGLALVTPGAPAAEIAELIQPEDVARGVVVYARAPGYAWGKVIVDVSTGAERELLLGAESVLAVGVTNYRSADYAGLPHAPTLYVTPLDKDGERLRPAWTQGLGESFEDEDLRLEGLEPGEYLVSVELGAAFSWRERVVHASEEIFLAAGEERRLVLPLPEAPAPAARGVLAGTLSFPAFPGADEVSLELYRSDYRHGDPDHRVPVASMTPTGAASPTWRFRVEDLTVGFYQAQLDPLGAAWLVEVVEGEGAAVELVVDELAEVILETVDGATGRLVPMQQLRHGPSKPIARQVADREAAVLYDGTPGRFRYWSIPGPAYVRTYAIPRGLDYGVRRQDVELVEGVQTLRFELSEVHPIRFEFRDGGAPLPIGDQLQFDVLFAIRPIGHEGEVIAVSQGYAEASAPGLYEIDFEGLGADRFERIPDHRFEVVDGEPTRVIIQLVRR